MRLTTADVEAAQREISKRHLIDFVRLAWPVIEPSQPYSHGWHMEAICEHLEAISRGEITRLLVNVPPGTSKSTLVGVFWPMWEWGALGKPSTRIVGVSHEQSLGIRDNLKCRRLVSSPWYQRLWPEVALTRDQNEKLNFENAQTGFRQVATPSNITGRRGDRVIVDDPLSAENANSDAEREKVNLWFRESLPTRLNNPDRSAIVVVMQRLHERDVSGIILSEGLGYEHLCLPMRFEPDRKCYTSIGFSDPRTDDGELLAPGRFPEHVVAELEQVMGSYAAAGQLQQRPTPREGGMFKRSWFDDKIKPERPKSMRGCRAWDLAATVKKAGNKPDWTAGVRMFRVGTDYWIDHVTRMQESSGMVSKAVSSYAETDPRGTVIRLPQDPGQAGKAQAEDYIKRLSGRSVVVQPVSGDKETRARPFAIQCEAGNVYLVEGEWNEMFLSELCNFPLGANDDMVDAAADAFNELALGSSYNIKAWS